MAAILCLVFAACSAVPTVEFDSSAGIAKKPKTVILQVKTTASEPENGELTRMTQQIFKRVVSGKAELQFTGPAGRLPEEAIGVTIEIGWQLKADTTYLSREQPFLYMARMKVVGVGGEFITSNSDITVRYMGKGAMQTLIGMLANDFDHRFL